MDLVEIVCEDENWSSDAYIDEHSYSIRMEFLELLNSLRVQAVNYFVYSYCIKYLNVFHFIECRFIFQTFCLAAELLGFSL